MKRGPKPKPNVLRLLDGSRLPINDDAPEPSPGAPAAPTWLCREAAAEWKRLVPALESVGLLSAVDRGNLALLCAAWAQYRESSVALKKGGTVYAAGEFQRASPWLKIQQDAAKLYNRLAGEFGLSPGARMQLKVATRDTPLASRSREDQLLG